MNHNFDALLVSGLVKVPEDFCERVMREINRLPQPAPKKTWQDNWLWLAISGSAVVGIVELFSYVFGIWTVTTAY